MDGDGERSLDAVGPVSRGKRVEGAPRVEPDAVDLDNVLGRLEREAEPDHAVGTVALDAGPATERRGGLRGRKPTRPRELVHVDGRSLSEQPEKLHPDPLVGGTQDGLRIEQLVGQARDVVRDGHCRQAAQQESFETSRLKICAASLKPSPMVR